MRPPEEPDTPGEPDPVEAIPWWVGALYLLLIAWGAGWLALYLFAKT